MINWRKDDWDEVKLLLDELDYDYEVDWKGDLIVRFENVKVINERNGSQVDHIDSIWLEFLFENDGQSYNLRFYRNNVYASNPEFVHPHVNRGSFCTGDYRYGLSLPRDLLYFKDYVARYNRGEEYATVPQSAPMQVDEQRLNEAIVPTFFLDLSVGYPVAESLELVGDINDFVANSKLSNPRTFKWKGKDYAQYSIGTRITHINLNDYFDYGKFYQSYYNATSTVSNADTVSEVA